MSTLPMKTRRKLILPQFLHLNHLTLKGVFLLLIILAAFQLYISNSFVTEGEKIKSNLNEIAQLEKENRGLKNQIQTVSALNHIEEVATSKGFGKVGKVEYVSSEVSVASR